MEPASNFRVLDDYLSTADAKVRARLSQRCLDYVSDMAVMDEVRVSLRVHPSRTRQPSKREHRAAMETSARDEPSTGSFRSNYFKKIQNVNVHDTSPILSKILKELCTKHPWPKNKMNLSWLERATSARNCLSRYWQAQRAGLIKTYRSLGLSEEYIAKEMSYLSADCSQEYGQELEAERQMIYRRFGEPKGTSASTPLIQSRKKDTPKSADVSPNIPLAAGPLNTMSSALESGFNRAREPPLWGNENEDIISKKAPEPTAKIKSRPRTDPMTALADVTSLQRDLAERSEQPQPTLQVLVKKQNITVLRGMYADTDGNAKASFSWQHFVTALIDTGFSAKEGSGSAVFFKHKDGQSIVFHRPHPDQTIHPIMLRSMGKRIAKWFGWNRVVFVERDEVAQA